MATLKTGTTIAGQTAWHTGNDGPGGGLDADTVDGVHAVALGTAQVSTTAPAVKYAGDLWTGQGAYFPTHDDAWTYATLNSPWYNFGGQYEPARYRKTIDGLLIMGGLIRGGTTGTIAFTLPVGYRPQYYQLMSTLNDNYGCRINIRSNGEVVPEKAASGSDWWSLRLSIWVG